MSSVEWPLDPGGALPAIVSSSDLFDGELFGDELIDIYNATMTDGHHTIDVPSLLKKFDEPPATEQVHDSFRPSNSYTDLTALLRPSDAAHAAPVSPTSTSHETAPSFPSLAETNDAKSKKRPAPTSLVGQFPKKKSSPKPRKAATAKKGVNTIPLDTGIPTNVISESPSTLVQDGPETKGSVVDAKCSKKKKSTKKSSKKSDQVSASVVAKSSVTSNGSGSSVTTEPEDFVGMARAAVNGLVQTAGTKLDCGSVAGSECSNEFKVPSANGPVDTSTEHIMALTSANWVAACSAAIPDMITTITANSSGASDDDDKANNRNRRQSLTADERARQNRDRNREHARNTRLRKKAYVDELKRTLMEVVVQRDTDLAEKKQAAQRELEQREVRFRVIEEFLKLRGRNEMNAARWQAILEPGFVFTLPRTDFRNMTKGLTEDVEQSLSTVPDIMADAAHMATFLNSTFKDSDDKSVMTLQYQCDRSKFFMDGCTAVLEWAASSAVAGAADTPSGPQLNVKGSFRALFSPASNKLLSGSMMFDSGVVSMQVSKRLQSRCGESLRIALVQSPLDSSDSSAIQSNTILDSLVMLPDAVASASGVTN
jgi:hypothetical protein